MAQDCFELLGRGFARVSQVNLMVTALVVNVYCIAVFFAKLSRAATVAGSAS